MDVSLIHNTYPLLAAVVDYIIFFHKSDSNPISYQTFPNTNLCVAIYKQNTIERQRNKYTNRYTIRHEGSIYTSRLWGFHSMPLQVEIMAPVEQICVNFKAGALRYFTSVPYTDLLMTANVWEAIFGQHTSYFIEQLFDAPNDKQRVVLLETFLLQKLREPKSDKKADWMIQRICTTSGNIRIKELANDLQINTSTLFRNFSNTVGQSPKDFIKTVRFRTALSSLLNGAYPKLIDVCYLNHYFDQAHFIKDFKQLTGTTPKTIRNTLSIVEDQFVWVRK